MKTISEKMMPSGRRRVTVELAQHESLLVVRDDAHYKLGDPVDDVVAGHVLSETTPVTWCSASQEWVR